MGFANPFTVLRESLRIRIFSLLTLLILLISASFSLLHFKTESASLAERSVIEGNLLARLLAHNSRIAVFAEHTDMLREAADGILQNDHVISATVFTPDGKLLINRARMDNALKLESPDILQTFVPLLDRIKNALYREKADYFEFYAPVVAGPAYSSPESLYFSESPTEQNDRVIGIVRVILDKRELNAHLRALMVTTVFMSALFLLLALICAYLVAQGLTRSLRMLMKGVTTLAQGDLSGRITVNSRDELGKVSHAFNTMAEALERREREKQALEEELRIAREHLAKEEWERTFDTVPDQIAILDTENRITRINAAMAILLNISKEKAIGTFLFEHFDGTIHPPYFSRMSDLLARGQTYSSEIYKEKFKKQFFITISPLFGTDGCRIGSVYVARDISEHKQATDALRTSEERFRLIAETIVEVIWMTDVEFTEILYVSPAYERVWGRSPEGLYADPGVLIDSIHPEDRERFLAVLESQSTGASYELEYRIVWPDGSIRWIWDRGYPVRNKDGKINFFTGVAEDITQKRQVEEEKQAIQAKLVQTNKMTSLGFLVSGLAHEVNNPNNCIKLAAHILSKSWDDIKPILENHYQEEGDFAIGGQLFSLMKDIMPQHISSITANSRRIEGIIKNLRDFAQKGVSNLNYEVDVNMVISLSASILNTQVKQHTRHFKLALEEGLPAVRGNPQQLEQVIINLVMNAIQALPDMGKKVLVATSFDREADCVVIRVKDEGEGMTKEVKDRIFEPFFSTKLDRGGSGLGLAISNFIIKEHKGSLDFESAIGRGTTAIVKLPRQT